jgi:hypothetical protein
MKFLFVGIIAVLVGLIVPYAMQTQARLTFPEYDRINKIDEFYFANDFRSPSACEDGLAYFRALPGQTTQPARCQYAPRFYVWGLKAQYILHRLAAWARVLSATQG